MKIELDEKDSAAMQGSILDTIKNLSPDKRDELVVKVMTDFLGSADLERVAINASLKDADYYGRERLGKHLTAREQLIAEVAKAAVSEFKSRVTEMVKTDKLLAETYEKVKAVIVEQFPNMVQHAMTSWFVSGMSQIGLALNSTFGLESKMQILDHEVRQRLGLPSAS